MLGAMEEVRFGRATESDAAQIWEVRTEAISVLCADHYPKETVIAWSAVPLHQGFIDLLRKVPFFIGRTENQIVASGFLDIERGRVEGMFVRPAFARRGIATSILRLVEDVARVEALPRLTLDATVNAAPFYERQGYAVLSPGTWRHPAGFDVGCIHMQKERNASPWTVLTGQRRGICARAHVATV